MVSSRWKGLALCTPVSKPKGAEAGEYDKWESVSENPLMLISISNANPW